MEENNVVAGFFEGTVLEKGYGYISREIMRNADISKGAKVVYCYLLSFAGDRFTSFPKVATVCRELGFKNQGTYYKYLNELKENGLLYTELVKNEKGKWDKNIFHLTKNKSDIEKVKSQNKKVKCQVDEKSKIDESIDTTGSRPSFKKCSTEICSSEKCSTNINIPNKNSINIILEEEEILKSYRDVKGRYLNSKEKEKIRELMANHSKDLILKAIDIMVTDAERVTLKYITSTLADWKSKDIQTVEGVDKMRVEWQEAKKKPTKRETVVVYKGKKESTFNNFKQREYDFKDLEKKLTGREEVINNCCECPSCKSKNIWFNDCVSNEYEVGTCDDCGATWNVPVIKEG